MGDGLCDPLEVPVRLPTDLTLWLLSLPSVDQRLKAAQPEGESNWPVPRQGRIGMKVKLPDARKIRKEREETARTCSRVMFRRVAVGRGKPKDPKGNGKGITQRPR